MRVGLKFGFGVCGTGSSFQFGVNLIFELVISLHRSDDFRVGYATMLSVSIDHGWANFLALARVGCSFLIRSFLILRGRLHCHARLSSYLVAGKGDVLFSV